MNRRCASDSHGPRDTSSSGEKVAQNFGTRALSQMVSAELEREEDQTLSTSSLNAFDDGSESSTATLCFTKTFGEQLAFVEVLGHNVMLHSDQKPVLVQLLKSALNRRPIETSVRRGPRISHQSQSKIENVNQVINGVCWSMWLTLENLLRETVK